MSIEPRIPTSIAEVDEHTITIRGHDLITEMMGVMSFTEAALLNILGRRPSEAEVALTDLVTVCLMEHGMMPANIVARLTYFGAPESLQGAVASGLCGVGSVRLGAVEECSHLLQDGMSRAIAAGDDHETAARSIVAEQRAAGRRIPGIGHMLHTTEDPRTLRLFEVAEQWGHGGRHIGLLQAISAEAEATLGRRLPINADGAAGAVLSNLGIDWRITRGFALIARTAGLVGHLYEEMRTPASPALLQRIEAGLDYQPNPD
jgi:citrate synthase